MQRDDLVRLRRARDRMDRDYAEPLDVPALAAEALMSVGHFQRSYKEAYGETPSDYRARSHDERAGIPSCVAKQLDRPTRTTRSGSEKRAAVAGA